MKYYSETTKKFYDNANDCMEEERALARKQEEAKIAQAKKDEERKAAVAKVDAARKAMVEAQRAYQKELEEFCKVYKSYHFTVNSEEEMPHFLDWFMNLL